MQPVLALELSTDGILLHELSYDGVWRKIAAASLNDPFLPKKMAAMRQAARASQGRFFKNQVWIPPEQFKSIETKLSAAPEDRQAEAEAVVRDSTGFTDGDYIVHFGEEDAYGNSKVVAISRAVLEEANRFASGYGFGSEGFTSSDRIGGFYAQPYFTISAPPKIALNYGKIGFFAGIGATAAAMLAGGYWAFTNIDFSRDPAIAIEAVEERVLELDEDPRAPIRPTDIALNPTQQTPAAISGGEDLGPLPEHDATVPEFEALVEQAALASSLDIAELPETSVPLDPVGVETVDPAVLTASPTDSLPAPETVGFPVFASRAPVLVEGQSPRDFEGGTAMSRYYAKLPEVAYVSSPRLTDVLPREDSTVALAAQLRKYNESFGLTQVRENTAAQALLAQASAFQLVPTVIVSGRPAILPILRNGEQVPDRLPDPPAPPPPTLTIAELQALPPVVAEGLPDLTPILRDGRDVAKLPDDPIPAPVPEPVAETDPAEGIDADAEPEVLFTTVVATLTPEQLQLIPPRLVEGRPPVLPVLRGGVEVGIIPEPVITPDPVDPAEEAARIAALQSITPVVLTGRPANLPILREGDQIDGGSGIIAEEPEPELTDAQRLRPVQRPDSVELTALVAGLSEQAVPNALAPLHRPAGFAAKVEELANTIAEQTRVTPTFNATPRDVSVPTSANVANTATIDNGINLRELSLIGVFGTSGAYRALLRKSGGKYQMVAIGDTFDGWTIVAISENKVRVKKGGRTKTLELPAEG